MLIQQNNGPLVMLALLILALAVALGMLWAGTEAVNPTETAQLANIRGTQAAMENDQRVAMWAATQTPLVAIAQATAVPMQLTVAHATHEAVIAQATQMAVANAAQATRQRLESEATRTQMILDAQRQEQDKGTQQAQTENRLALILAAVIGGTVLICVGVGAYVLTQWQKAQTAAHAARAYAEQRRLLIVQAALKEQEGRWNAAVKATNGRSQPALHQPDEVTHPQRPSA
ncbi:MAG: hypothetical protein IAE79_03605 [Anaerolinea sp.]|nr:hypothetical protein [Anaerolinea sp.]